MSPSVFIKSFGCSANISDGEIMSGMLQGSGRQLVDSAQKADTIVLNTCTVKGKTDSQIKRIIRSMHSDYPKKSIVIAGCMAQAQGSMLREFAPFASQLGPHQIDEIVGVVERAESGQVVLKTDKNAQVKANLPKLRSNPVVNIVQINEGCLGSCTFCITKLAKPRLLSFPMAQVAADVKQGISDGCKEVWLTSQDTAAYGKEFRRSLPMLLDEVLKLEGDFRVRIGMMNPDNILGSEDALIERLKHPKLFKFLHIPVQTGSDAVLKRMRRAYTVDEFKGIVAKLRVRIPDITLATDIICGFPGETDEQFEETLELAREIRFDTINISRYWERPGTRSAQMSGKLNGRITKERSTRLAHLFWDIAKERNELWLGWQGEILVDERGKAPGTWVGRNYAYKPIVVRSEENLLGKNVKVKILEATTFDLRGTIAFQYVLSPHTS